MLLIDQEQVIKISKFQLLKLKGSSFRMHLLLPTFAGLDLHSLHTFCTYYGNGGRPRPNGKTLG